SMVGFFFIDRPVEQLEDVDASDHELFSRVFHHLLDEGVHLPPSPYETLFISAAHGKKELDHTIAAFDRALAEASATE
ncbi:MAG: aspartate aminotransferase family protein, partial [Acidobacteriota bacterium]